MDKRLSNLVNGEDLIEEAIQLSKDSLKQQDIEMAKSMIIRSYGKILVLPFPDELVDRYVDVLKARRQSDLPKLINSYIREIKKILEF